MLKKLKSLFVGFSILSLFALSALICSCKTEPEPQLTEPVVTLALSKTAGQKEVIISWTPSDDAEGYSIERTMVRDSVTDTRYFEWISSDPLCSKDDSKYYLTDNSCESGTEYTYVVTALATREVSFSEKNYSKRSEAKSITTAADPKVTLKHPANVKVVQTPGNRNALTVSWDAVENASGYEIYYTNSAWIHFNEKFIKTGTSTQTSFTKEHLTNETDYTFMIKAINGNNYSLFSAKVSESVAKADNFTKDKALVLENGVTENLYASDKDSFWFKCSPQTGTLIYSSPEIDYESSLSIFKEDGSIVASGLSLFIYDGGDGKKDENITLVDDKENDDYIISRNIKNSINGFASGTTYYLRVVKNANRRFSICVE